MTTCEQPKNEILPMAAGCVAGGSNDPRAEGVAKLEGFRNTEERNEDLRFEI